MLPWWLSTNSGTVISGALAVSRHLCRLSELLYVGSALEKSEVSGTLFCNQLHCYGYFRLTTGWSLALIH